MRPTKQSSSLVLSSNNNNIVCLLKIKSELKTSFWRSFTPPSRIVADRFSRALNFSAPSGNSDGIPSLYVSRPVPFKIFTVPKPKQEGEVVGLFCNNQAEAKAFFQQNAKALKSGSIKTQIEAAQKEDPQRYKVASLTLQPLEDKDKRNASPDPVMQFLNNEILNPFVVKAKK